MSHERMVREQKRLREEVKRLLAEAEQADTDEDKRYGRTRRGDELPAELDRREERLRRIQEARKALQERARAKAEEKQKDKDGDNKNDKYGPSWLAAPSLSPSRKRSTTSPTRSRAS